MAYIQKPDEGVAAAFCEAAGIDPMTVRRVRWEFEVGAVQTVEFEVFVPTEPDMTTIKRFELTPIED